MCVSAVSLMGVKLVKQVVNIPGGPKSEASAYFCLYLLNALTKSNNLFWHTKAAVYDEYCTE